MHRSNTNTLAENAKYLYNLNQSTLNFIIQGSLLANIQSTFYYYVLLSENKYKYRILSFGTTLMNYFRQYSYFNGTNTFQTLLQATTQLKNVNFLQSFSIFAIQGLFTISNYIRMVHRNKQFENIFLKNKYFVFTLNNIVSVGIQYPLSTYQTIVFRNIQLQQKMYVPPFLSSYKGFQIYFVKQMLISSLPFYYDIYKHQKTKF